MAYFSMGTYKVGSFYEMEEIAHKFAESLKGGDVVAFKGSMGVGKTTFVRGIAKAFGIEDEVSSPTFAIMNEYDAGLLLHHYDMYRVNDWDSLYSTGFFDDMDDEKIIVLIEWSENITKYLPEEYIIVQLSYGEKECDRLIKIQRVKGGQALC